jgi:hypothetical protein
MDCIESLTSQRRIQFVHQQVQALRRELGSEVYDIRLNEIKEKILVTFTSVRKGEAAQSFKEVINQPHVACSGLSPIWKTQRKGTDNLRLFKAEWRGRKIKSLGRGLTRDEERAINETMKITSLKTAIRADKNSHYASEYEDGYDEKFFTPRHTEYDDWKWSKV